MQWNGPLEPIKQNTKLVLMYGTSEVDAVRLNHRRAYGAMLLDGFQRVTLFEIPRLNHFFPSATWFERGVAALEAPPKKPPTTAPTIDPNPLPGQVAVARRMLVSAKRLLDLGEARWTAAARKHLQRVIDEYPTTPAAAEARELLKQIDSAEPSPTHGAGKK